MALPTGDLAVSNDPDFWDPKKGKDKCVGDAGAPVAKLCREELGVTVWTLKSLVVEIT